MNNGLIFDIQRFSLHDGPGIRTTVFMKGCPLRCLWCHNPESQENWPELSFVPEKCIGCGRCFQECPSEAHRMEGGKHVLDRLKCVRCGRCAEKCYGGALTTIGRAITADEVIAEVLRDKPFYGNSGGGMTLSGGEPMFQFEFTMELLKAAKTHGLNICMETCGTVSVENYAETLPYVEIYLFDIKESDPVRHLEYTGAPLEPILKSLEFLNFKNAGIILRCPVVPGLNDREAHFRAIGELASRLNSVLQIDVEPYCPLGISKSGRIGKNYLLPELKSFPDKSETGKWVESIKSSTSKPVLLM